MTTGTWTRDQQVLTAVPPPAVGLTAKTGYLSTKTWSGADYPKVNPHRAQVRAAYYDPRDIMKRVKMRIKKSLVIMDKPPNAYLRTPVYRPDLSRVVVPSRRSRHLSTKVVRGLKIAQRLRRIGAPSYALRRFRAKPIVPERYLEMSKIISRGAFDPESPGFIKFDGSGDRGKSRHPRRAAKLPSKRVKTSVGPYARARIYRPHVHPPKRSTIAEHNYTMTYSRRNDVVFQWFGLTGVLGGVYSTAGMTPGVGYAWTTSHDQALLGRLRDKVAGSDFNAGVFLGEGHQALKMIGDSARSIGSALVMLKRGNFNAAARALSSSSSTRHGVYVPPTKSNAGWEALLSRKWLELMYGWLPLLKDAEAGAQFLAHAHSVPLQFIVKASVKLEDTVPSGLGSEFVSNLASRRQDTIKAILTEKSVVGLAGLSDPLSVLWELTPYSFVVDWFIPIGAYLQNRGLSQALTGTFVTTSYTKTRIGPLTNRATNRVNGPGAGEFSYAGGSLIRNVSTTLPVNVPSVKPLLKVASWQHCANAVALLVNNFSSVAPLSPVKGAGRH